MTVTPELVTREFKVRKVNSDRREVTGLAVPYGVTIDLGPWGRERFEPGAIEHDEDQKLFYGHTEPIGRIVAGRDTDEGYEITARISETARGNEVYTLLQDGVLNRFSVGFFPVEYRVEDEDVTVHTKVDLREVSVVAIPAYDGAKVSEVRSAADHITDRKGVATMSDETTYATPQDVAGVRNELEDLERRMTVGLQQLQDGTDHGNTGPVYRSGGEFLKALLTPQGREYAQRVFTGATTVDANSKDAWVDRLIKLKDERRNVLNLFSREPLPATGNNVDFPVLASVTGDVGVQVNEGDDLNYLEVVIGEDTIPVKTYGGYSSLSRQAIERSSTPYLSKVLEYQAMSYAKVTNAAVRTALTGAVGTGTGAVATVDAVGWLDAVIQAVADIEANSYGLAAEFMLMSTAAFKTLFTLDDGSGRPLFTVNGDGSNSIGGVNVRGLSGTVAGLPVVVDPGLTGTDAYVLSSQALMVMESAGAPFRLEDENIINLTKDFSLYGYLAVGVSDAAGIVKIDTVPGV